MTTAATTELESINIMLAAIGEAPVNSLTGTVPVDVRLAQSTLTEINKEIQSEGWSFNTEIDVTLNRNDTTKQIVLSTDILRIDPNIHQHPTIDFKMNEFRPLSNYGCPLADYSPLNSNRHYEITLG